MSAGQYQLYHTTHLGLGYVYLLEQSQGLGYHELESGLRPTLTATDMHAGSDCGPRVIEYPESCTQLNCDRDAYLFGDGSSQFLSSLRHGWLIQDVHDPNDYTLKKLHSEAMSSSMRATRCPRHRRRLQSLSRSRHSQSPSPQSLSCC